LIYVQERTGGPELICGNHELAGSDAMRIGYIYTIRTTVSSINLNAQDITGVSSPTVVATCTVNG
jgi:hypothetical protein